MSYNENKDLKFCDVYPIVISDGQDVSVLDLPFSVRLKNVLMRNKITTLSAILSLRIADFESLRNLGNKTVKELKDYLNSLLEKNQIADYEIYGNVIKPKLVSENFDAFLVKDCDFLNNLSDTDRKSIEPYINSLEILGTNLTEICYREPMRILPIIRSFKDFTFKFEQDIEINKRIKNFMNEIPFERLNQSVIGYITAYTRDEEKIEKLRVIYSLDKNKNAKLKDFSKEIILNSYELLLIFQNFLKWCSFDIKSEIDILFSDMYSNSNTEIVLKGRACGKTLQMLGDFLNISRERIRQLELKAKQKFGKWQAKKRVLSKISAVRDSDTILSPVELRDYFGEYYSEMLFLLRTYDNPAFKYDSQLDVFVLGDESLASSAFEFVESLPSSFDDEKYREYLEMLEEREIPLELFEKAFIEEYRKDGSTYHRIKQTLTEIYKLIMKNHFPHGISIYDEQQMQEFRRIAIEEYGCQKLPENDRAIYARIQDICIMYDKGRYKPKSKEYIAKELADKIHSYIVNSSSTIFLTNVLFNIFEEELVSFGIDNKYYMQAVLRELYGNEFFFRRDYVSKDDTVTSLYAELVQFVKKFDYPITREDVYKEFPGLTDIVLNIAAADPDVLNLFGKYIHGSKLPFVATDRSYFMSVINRFLNDDGVCHYDEIYKYIVRDDEDLLRRLFINVPTSLFSVLEYLFRDDYQFKRPFIAKQGVTIENPAVQLKEIILSSDMIMFADITEFMKENHYQVYSYLDYYNSFSDTHLIASSDALATFEYLGIDENVARTAICIIEENVTECIPIRDMTCMHHLPKINAPWHEWLIYSVVRKWSEKLETGVSNAQFKYALPLIAPKGCMDASKFGGQATALTSVYRVDDLDNIDELIEDFIDFEEDL